MAKRFRVWQQGSVALIPAAMLRAFPKQKPKPEDLVAEHLLQGKGTRAKLARDLREAGPHSLLRDGGMPRAKSTPQFTLAAIALQHWEGRKEGVGIRTRADAWHFAFLDLAFNMEPVREMELPTKELARRFAEEICEEVFEDDGDVLDPDDVQASLLNTWKEKGWL